MTRQTTTHRPVRTSRLVLAAALMFAGAAGTAPAADEAPRFDRQIAPLLKAHCVKCHGPAKREGGLNLSTPAGVLRGGKNGPVLTAHDVAASRLWERIENDDMPPDEPLTDDEKSLLKRWIVAGAPGLPARAAGTEGEHWAFLPLAAQPAPAVRDAARPANDVDRFIQAALDQLDLVPAPEADRRTLIRRVSLDLTGLPPTLEEIETFLADSSANAYPRMVERYLGSPHYGERWGKYWLDAAGYADSNGYFNADSDRPLAWRYRDYVVQAFNEDRPFDRFVTEQLAGDELAPFAPGQPVDDETIERLVATHYLRNGQDGSGESDGNPDEVRVDRYTALESSMQIVASSLLGLTIQCAKCHEHKFEPIPHRDFYQLQAVLYPVFNIEQWVKPNDRVVFAPRPGEQETWERQTHEADERVSSLRTELAAWVRANRPPGEVLFADAFEASRLTAAWSNTAPGDDVPGGATLVTLDAEAAPAARINDGRLEIIESGAAGDRWISTQKSFDWTPDEPGASIQVTFDLVDNKLAGGNGAERVGYLIALHDFNDNSATAGGNLLIDGNPGGPTSVYIDYPGDDSRGTGPIGQTGYAPGHNYGVRITNAGDGKFRLEQLVDWVPEEKSLTLDAVDLPDGGFGFEFCCNRSFVVDNVIVERNPASAAAADSPIAKFNDELKQRRDALNKAVAAQSALAGRKPGKIALATDMAPAAPEVHLLERGNYSTPGAVVEPGALSALIEPDVPFAVAAPFDGAATTGRRLAFARWLTRPGSRAAALFARVQVNRIWQHHFGTGIVATPDNLGVSGAEPSHPELLDWLAGEFIRSGWSVKAIHRLILNSATYRQSSATLPPFARGGRGGPSTEVDAPDRKPAAAPGNLDPDNRLLARFPIRRLESDAIRDSMLAAAGDLDRTTGGPYIPTTRDGTGEVLVAESTNGARRRAIYLQQRRSQVLSFLAVFDSPSIVFNSVRRAQSTMPLQSLSLLNSEFAVARSKSLAARAEREQPDEMRRVGLVWQIVLARDATPEESAAALEFIETQTREYADQPDARSRAWQDFCQSLLASNEFLYVE